MEVKKGLSFAQAKANIMERRVAFFGVLLCTILLWIALAIMMEKRIISDGVGVGAAQGAFLGVAIFSWRVIKGDFKKKK